MKLVFSDLIDVARAQELMDGYYAVTGIPTGIIDGEGNVWTATGWLDICTKFHRANPVTAERCKESDTYIKHHLDAGGSYVSYKCAHGLTDVASPIVVAGQHVAQVMTGQLFLKEPDIEFFRKQAREFGFDEDAYLRALAEVPVITEEKLDAIMKFLAQLAQLLADMGYKRLKEMEALEEVVRLNRELESRVAERREAEERLRANEKIYSDIFTHIGIGIALIGPEMEILFLNPVMERINPQIDVSRRPICYRSFNIPPRDEICSYCPTILTFRDGKIHVSVTDTPTPDGIRHFRVISAPVFSADGAVASVIEAVEDITENKLADEALRQKEICLQGILESTADGILAIDEKGKVIKANQKFAELWKIPESILLGGNDEVLLKFVLNQLQDPEGFLKKVKSLYGSRETDIDNLYFKDGRIFERFSAPLVEDGAIIGRVWSFRDITEKRKMEEDILRSQKMESVGLLAGGIAHDFNNLLTAILGNISLAKAQLPKENKVQPRLFEAEKASLRARDLTQQLLTFAKGGSPLRRCSSLSDLIRETVGFALSGSNVRCEFHIAPGLHYALIDQGQISQVIHNLIINADQAMPVGGTLRISCFETSIEEGEAPPLKEGRYIRIEICDQGVGIPAQFLSRIFDPFFTTKETGRGLGLATAYSIIRNHDGQISVASEQGKGTVFTIHLPVCCEKPEEEHDDENPMTEGTGRILVMDDEDSVLEIAGEMLSHLGYEAVCVHDGGEALELYQKGREDGDPFRAVIADLTIPGGMGGREMAERLREIDPEIKMIVSSGYSNDPVLSDYRSFGFCGVITKPYLTEDVSKALAEALGRSHA